jgi:hypothetical protein
LPIQTPYFMSIADICRCHVTNCHVWRSCIALPPAFAPPYFPLLPSFLPLLSSLPFLTIFATLSNNLFFAISGFSFIFRLVALFSPLLHYSQDQDGRPRASRNRQATGSDGQPPATNNNEQTQVGGCKTLQTTEISKHHDPMELGVAMRCGPWVVDDGWWATVGGRRLVGDSW